MNFNNKAPNQTILWLGIAGQSLGVLNPLETVDFDMSAYPIRTGLQTIPCISVTEVNTCNNYEFDEMAYVFVKET